MSVEAAGLSGWRTTAEADGHMGSSVGHPVHDTCTAFQRRTGHGRWGVCGCLCRSLYDVLHAESLEEELRLCGVLIGQIPPCFSKYSITRMSACRPILASRLQQEMDRKHCVVAALLGLA